MRIAEIVTEDINPDILNPQFRHEQKIGDYTYTATTSTNYGLELVVQAFDGKKQIGKCDFEIIADGKPPRLVSNDTWVDGRYQEQGVATTMYAYAKMLGNDIVPHEIQSDAGNRMWRSWHQAKQSKHIMPRGYDPFKSWQHSKINIQCELLLYEAKRKVFWTRVRLPPGPPKAF